MAHRKSTIGVNPLDQLGRIGGRGHRPTVQIDPATRADIGKLMRPQRGGRSAAGPRRKGATSGITGWMKSVWRSLAG